MLITEWPSQSNARLLGELVDERELITGNIDGDYLYVALLLLDKNGSGEVLSRTTRVYDEGLRGERTGL